VLFQVRHDALGRIGRDAGVAVTCRCEGNIVTIQSHLQSHSSDDDDVVANPVAHLRRLEHQRAACNDSHHRISARIASAASSARSPAERQSR
jgi:hypothetical protein